MNTEAWPASEKLLETAVRATLATEQVSRGEVSVTLLGDHEMVELNRLYLGHDDPTDVLSFALYGEGEPVLGDVYLGFQQAERQARERDIPLQEELVRLAVHGTLHLLGYDHPPGPEREDSLLFQKQEKLVRRVLGAIEGD